MFNPPYKIYSEQTVGETKMDPPLFETDTSLLLELSSY